MDVYDFFFPDSMRGRDKAAANCRDFIFYLRSPETVPSSRAIIQGEISCQIRVFLEQLAQYSIYNYLQGIPCCRKFVFKMIIFFFFFTFFSWFSIVWNNHNIVGFVHQENEINDYIYKYIYVKSFWKDTAIGILKKKKKKYNEGEKNIA